MVTAVRSERHTLISSPVTPLQPPTPRRSAGVRTRTTGRSASAQRCPATAGTVRLRVVDGRRMTIDSRSAKIQSALFGMRGTPSSIFAASYVSRAHCTHLALALTLSNGAVNCEYGAMPFCWPRRRRLVGSWHVNIYTPIGVVTSYVLFIDQVLDAAPNAVRLRHEAIRERAGDLGNEFRVFHRSLSLQLQRTRARTSTSTHVSHGVGVLLGHVCVL